MKDGQQHNQTKLKIHLFSVLREKVGQDELHVALPPASRGSDLLDHLSRHIPHIAPYRDVIRLAVNESYVRSDVMLEDGDEVALITPVSGG